MADSDEWFVGEDGCLSVGKPVEAVTYHSTLNTILVATKEPSVQVLDVTSGSVLQNSDLSAVKSSHIHCNYLSGRDKVLFTNGHAVGIRKDLNGILLLDTALQTPTSRTEDVVKVELSLPDANHLFKCLMSAELPGVDYVEDVIRELEKEIETVQQATKANHKVAKWATVCLKLPHCALKTVCSSLVMELKRLHQHVPGLPVASAISDRMTYLLLGNHNDGSAGQVDRSLMYSETARRETFSKWPHMHYKWALPDAMAQAGFYHQPSSTGDDRAMCFTCNVCLVCWEPTDEPWSEHERHSPTCPFVKGEYTQNVPIAVTYATEPAQMHGAKGTGEKIECVSTSSSDDFAATSTLHGNVVVWNLSRQMKRHIQFHIDPWEPMIMMKTGSRLWHFDDLGSKRPPPKEAWTDTTQQSIDTEASEIEMESESGDAGEQQQQQQQEVVDNNNDENQHDMGEDQESQSDENKLKASIIVEMSGAWKQSKQPEVNAPLEDASERRDVMQRFRPSQDVLVSSLCVLGPPKTGSVTDTSKTTGGASVAASPAPTAEANTALPCLVSGVAIRRHTLGVSDLQILSDAAHALTDDSGEVQAMNKVNQALSGENTPQIIDETSVASTNTNTSSLIMEKGNPFIPYLLIHDISPMKGRSKEWRSKSTTEKSVQPSTSSSGTKVSSLVSTVQDFYMPQIVEMEEEGPLIPPPLPPPVHDFFAMKDMEKELDEDPDVQIVGMSMPPKFKPPGVHPSAFVFGNSSGKQENNSAVQNPPGSSRNKESNSSSSRLGFHKEGQVIQCIELPMQVTSDQYVASLTPTLDGHHLVVVTVPKCLHRTIGILSGSINPSIITTCDGSTADSHNNTTNTSQSPPSTTTTSEASLGSPSIDSSLSASCQTGQGGCLVIYRVNTESEMVLLDEQPLQICVIDNVDDAIKSVLMLPTDVAAASEDEEGGRDAVEEMVEDDSNQDEIVGQIVITTQKGDVKILRLNDFKLLARIEAPEGEKFVSTTYCAGMDRLCASTGDGKLHFFVIGPRSSHTIDGDYFIGESSPIKGSNMSSKDDSVDYGGNLDGQGKFDDLLVKQPPTTDVLMLLHELTQFENLMPRFSATVPPCWNEIQQEQQQRRHPQHLQQQGESMQHTRTWRLQQDSSNADEHLFELVLTRTCSLGHIDLKFTLHPLCTTAPNLQVTLLKQNVSSIGRNIISQPRGQTQVDTKINFNMETEESDQKDTASGSVPTTQSDSPGSTANSSVINNVLDPQFLKRYGAEILSGPVDLANHVDLSGHSGIITLTSPHLLKVKSRSFLIHIKALPSEKDATEKEKSKPSTSTASTTADKSSKPALKNIWDPFNLAPGTERLSSAVHKQKLENVKGCDWLQEVSITVRRSKKTNVPRDRLQRYAMVDSGALHEQLLVTVCGQDDKLALGTSREHRQALALDILAWIAALQMNDPNKEMDNNCMIFTVQSNLKGLVKSCFIEAGRTIAHKCAKLISICIEYAKTMADPNLAPAFNFALLHSLLECLPLISCAYSSGALRWFFTLLNRVKCMDISLTGQKCIEILSHVAKHYHDRNNPLHSLLKARYGLYGTPLDPLLFDIEPPQLSKSSSTANSSYSAVLSSNIVPVPQTTMNAASTTTTVNTMVPSVNLQSTSATQHIQDEVDFKDLMSLNSSDKTSRSQLNSVQRHTYGLIEVEPLHFTCHATSDGTRMERMDITSNLIAGNSNVSGLSGTINFGETLSTATAAGAALASLSTAMASAEQQLQLLQQKQQQLFKLQQKLAATTKSISNSASAHSTPPSGASSYAHYNSTEFLPPPTPKTTPLFMTPPVTPPNESFYQVFGQPVKVNPGKQSGWEGPGGIPFNQLYTVKVGAGKAPVSIQTQQTQQKAVFQLSQAQNLLQPPPAQVLVVERMHSGARRFVVLDFGKPILLTDVIIPACNDLASLSIDVWVQGEEVDGQRLVVSTDIGIRSLVMNDLSPPPVCRYLKITTIGRYGGSTTRSRIPIGSFYGHSIILPWECDMSVMANATSGGQGSLEQTQIISQLSTFMALQEDIQCRYSLACNRLVSLLSAIDTPQNNSSHTRYYLRKGKKSEEDMRIHQAYQDCMQLQMQLNLAQHAMERLQKVLGIQVQMMPNNQTGVSLLKQASTDKLRVLAELMLDTLLSMTVSSPSIPQLPLSLYSSFSPQACEALFRNLCINGTRRMQIHAGVLLVRLCGNQTWWGDFLGNILQEFFSSEEPEIFPQDRVFILLTALGQKALSGSSADEMLESILMLLGKLLSPLLVSQHTQHHGFFMHNTTQLDLSLIGWLLLFLSRNLDNTHIGPNSDDEKPSKDKDKDSGGGSSRWDFLQGEAAMQNSRLSAKSNSSKLYRRKLQKRLMHHKQQLLDLQQAKKNFLSSQIEKNSNAAPGGLVSKEAEVMLKQQEQLFKRQLKQYSSKHFKDIMQIRRTDGEILKKMPKDNSTSTDKDVPDVEIDTHLIVSREKCVPVVKGLMALLLSMDFTCNVDLFLIACKVIARLTNVTRPAISLSEVMCQEELEKLVLLCCNIEFNHGNISWGGAWSGHAITCLLQDILDGEKLYPVSAGAEGVTDDEMSAYTETDPSLQNSTTLPTMEEDSQASENTTGVEASGGSKNEETFKFDKESSLIVDMLLDDEDCDEETNAKLQDYITGELDQAFKFKQNSNKSFFQFMNNTNNKGWSSGFPPVNWGVPATGMPNVMGSFGAPGDEKKQKFESWKNKLASYGTDKPNITPQGVSTAMDSRLEHGVQLQAELKLRVMVSLETESIQAALLASMPPPVPGLARTFSQAQPPGTDEEQLSESGFLNSISQQPVVASHEMLSMCFNNLFTQLQLQRVNLENLLLTWLTLNDETTQEENNHSVFDPSKVPSIPLNQNAVTSLIAALAWTPTLPVRTWVLAFQSLTLLSNLKCVDVVSGAVGAGSSGQDKWLATAMVADSNMMTVFIKFLSGTSLHGPVISSHQYTQVGPTATKALQELLVRLQLRCAEDNENHLKELLLKLVYTLATERGAFHSGLGPLDAQCKLMDHMLEQTYESIDISNAISVIESLALLVHQHIVSQEKVVCHSASENSVSARSCFGGLFASMLRSGDSRTMMGDANRDVLMCSLLKLVNILVQIPLPGRSGPPRRNLGSGSVFMDVLSEAGRSFEEESPMTDSSKICQSLTATSTPILVTPNNAPDDEKGSETDEQKTENNANKPRSCIHFTDLRNPEDEVKEATLSDVVLVHPQIMRHLIQALSCCNSNTMAMILGSSGLQGSMQDSFTGTDPLSVGDGIFLILCTLNKKATDVNLILKPILEYLSSGFGASRISGISRLSEPLLWFVLRVLDCEVTIRNYLTMGGIEIVCQNLVSSNQRVINVSPSLVSTIMQYLGNGKTAPVATLKRSGTDTDNAEGLQNFAPLGMVTSSSPTAGPADVLIQASPPHRRARSAAWSYHFYPDEAWVDLTISLPCAVLLKEIHIQPHLTSLATCPSAVSVEVSRDGTTSIPVCSPVLTSGLTLVKLQMLKSEVVTAVTIRLHKPRDSATIGLSQIMLLGYTAFGETGTVRATSIFLPTEDYVSRTSIGWLRLLHHCLTQCESVSSEVAAAAAPAPNLLVTCTALLVSHSAALYANNIESVLLKIGLHSTDMGLALIDHILRNSSAGTDERGLPLHGKVNGMANDSTVDILFQLGTTQDDGTASRVKALLDWLGDSARVALQRSHMESGQYTTSPRHTVAGLPNPAAAHIHCMAAILWQSLELPVTYDLPGLVTRDLLSCMYEWSVTLPAESILKKAIDCVICSMCYIHPQYFSSVLEWTGIVINIDLNSAYTDDHKDSAGQYQSMTDDSKEASGAFNTAMLSLQEFGHMILDETHLSTLALACQSPEALRRLLLSGFPAVLCQGLYEFCTREALRHNDTLSHPEMFTDATKSNSAGSSPHSPRTASSRTRTNSESSQSDKGLCITADLVAPVLRFLAEISKESVMKDWLGGSEGNIFWPTLLNLLCNTLTHQPGPQQLHTNRTKVMTSPQRSAIETATVAYFCAVISCHPENQHMFASVLCEVIRGQGPGTNSFTRRLFLQVLLEDEKILVSFRSTAQLYKGQSGVTVATIWHPRCGAGHKYRALSISLQKSCSDVLSKVSDTPSLTAQLLEDRDDKGVRDPDKKDTNELGLEVVDKISAEAGLQAKEKREKTDNKLSTPPRPPSRRGLRAPDATLGGSVHVPVLSLCHSLLPGHTLPGDLTLSQLLTLLHERGFPQGQSCIDLNMKLSTKKVTASDKKAGRTDAEMMKDLESPPMAPIPEEVLMDTVPFPSALQVFASVGGLALLAEHLPLLYPEVTRQVSPPPISDSHATSNSFGNDWVTVESTEDIYEDIYEPMPPSHVSQPSKQNAQVLPSIPPHSLVAFGLFLRLPGFAEVLLKERKRAQCLLRLVLGVTDDGEGGHILTSNVASALPTLPFNVLKSLFDTTPLTTDDGVLLRRMTLEIGAVHLVLACLSVLSHHAPRSPIPGFHQEIILGATQAASALSSNPPSGKAGEEKGQSYWAKGTGFGTGSTTSSWDAEQALLRQKSEEEHVTCLLQVLSSYINPNGIIPEDFKSPEYNEEQLEEEKNSLPAVLPELLSQSCLVPAISSYLRNDSVLDMARHVPLYRSLLELLRGIAVCPPLVNLLLPLDKDDDSNNSVSSLLEKMKTCVDTYANRLKSNKSKSTSSNNSSGKSKQEDEETEGLALLIPDIQETARIVHSATSRIRERSAELDSEEEMESEGHALARNTLHSREERYMRVMKEFQFDTYEMVVEEDNGIKFTILHHYESNVKAAGDVNNAARARRLAQEAVTLSTSLPLSYSSSVFVRCDEERLDVMKVWITGPSDTPYANGCFEFDVYFPQDYPNSPPLINLETTGNHTVRFNPNLYNDGKVCLSVLNTWHGRPEEKWNSQTSSFLQVLVSIQSLILVSEPYFNEPGYERSRGTPSGTASSREYDANIRQASVKWAMLEQLRNPSPCFKDAVDRHFWLKRHEIIQQIEGWIAEMEVTSGDKRTGRTISHSCVALKRHFGHLKDEFLKMKCPEGLEDEEDLYPPFYSESVKGSDPAAGPSKTNDMDTSNASKVQTKDTVPQTNGPKLIGNSLPEAGHPEGVDDKGNCSSTESSTSEPSTSEPEDFHAVVKC